MDSFSKNLIVCDMLFNLAENNFRDICGFNNQPTTEQQDFNAFNSSKGLEFYKSSKNKISFLRKSCINYIDMFNKAILSSGLVKLSSKRTKKVLSGLKVSFDFVNYSKAILSDKPCDDSFFQCHFDFVNEYVELLIKNDLVKICL